MSPDGRHHETSEARTALLCRVADIVPRLEDLNRNVFVGIDGVDGSGKTTFADELAEVLSAARPTVRISIDGFHKQRAERYRLGRDSPEGFWEDSYDYEAFERGVILPLRAGTGRYLAASHDLDTDELLDGPYLQLASPSVVVVDGIFLHRPELREFWDFSILLEVDFTVSVPRMAARDGSSPSPVDPSNRRYVEGQRIYLNRCAPRSSASLTIDNNDLLAPKIVGRRR